MSSSSSSSSCSCAPAMSSSSSSSASSPSSSNGGASTPDKFYGHKDLSEFCEYIVADMFCMASPLSESPPRSPGSSPGSKKSPPRLAEFIAYAIYRTRLAEPIVHQALFYLQRLKSRYPAARGTDSSPHRLFLSALMLAAKMSMDDCYSNKSWAIVGGNFFSLREVNQMERELFGFLGFDLSCDLHEMESYVNDRQLDWESRRKAAESKAVSCYYPQELLASSHRQDVKKRRVSDPVSAATREQALRHKRASDAAVALLRPGFKSSASHGNLQQLRSQVQHQKQHQQVQAHTPPRAFVDRSCQSTPPSLTSGSSSHSPSEASTPYSPLSMNEHVSPEMTDACDRFNSSSLSPSFHTAASKEDERQQLDQAC